MADRLLTDEEIGIKWDTVVGYPCQQKLITRSELESLLKRQDAKTTPIVRRETAAEIFGDLINCNMNLELSMDTVNIALAISRDGWRSLVRKWKVK